jgi:hypothetical protein
MNVSCDITIDLDDINKVKTVLKSIAVDDFDFVKSKVVGKRLVAKIESKSIPSLLHTLDDYLACVSVAVKVVNKD